MLPIRAENAADRPVAADFKGQSGLERPERQRVDGAAVATDRLFVSRWRRHNKAAARRIKGGGKQVE